MQIIRRSLLAVVGLAFAAPPALALDHLMKVNEILLANAGGSATSQFLELEDPGEPFPNSYALHVYDAAGTDIGSQAIDPPAGTTRMTLATAQARTDFSLTLAPGVVLDLTVALPANGTLCFQEGGARIHCLSWGTVTSIPTGGGVTRGPAPANGQSVQRIGACAIEGAPTPNATNITGTCTTPMPDAGVPDAPQQPIDAAGADAGGGGNNNSSDDDGCSVGGGASWFALVGLIALVVIGRSSRRRR